MGDLIGLLTFILFLLFLAWIGSLLWRGVTGILGALFSGGSSFNRSEPLDSSSELEPLLYRLEMLERRISKLEGLNQENVGSGEIPIPLPTKGGYPQWKAQEPAVQTENFPKILEGHKEPFNDEGAKPAAAVAFKSQKVEAGPGQVRVPPLQVQINPSKTFAKVEHTPKVVEENTASLFSEEGIGIAIFSRLGILMVFLGVLFFVALLFPALPPLGRAILCYLFAASFGVLAYYFRNSLPEYSEILGVASFLLFHLIHISIYSITAMKLISSPIVALFLLGINIYAFLEYSLRSKRETLVYFVFFLGFATLWVVNSPVGFENLAAALLATAALMTAHRKEVEPLYYWGCLLNLATLAINLIEGQNFSTPEVLFSMGLILFHYGAFSWGSFQINALPLTFINELASFLLLGVVSRYPFPLFYKFLPLLFFVFIFLKGKFLLPTVEVVHFFLLSLFALFSIFSWFSSPHFLGAIVLLGAVGLALRGYQISIWMEEKAKSKGDKEESLQLPFDFGLLALWNGILYVFPQFFLMYMGPKPGASWFKDELVYALLILMNLAFEQGARRYFSHPIVISTLWILSGLLGTSYWVFHLIDQTLYNAVALTWFSIGIVGILSRLKVVTLAGLLGSLAGFLGSMMNTGFSGSHLLLLFSSLLGMFYIQENSENEEDHPQAWETIVSTFLVILSISTGLLPSPLLQLGAMTFLALIPLELSEKFTRAFWQGQYLVWQLFLLIFLTCSPGFDQAVNPSVLFNITPRSFALIFVTLQSYYGWWRMGKNSPAIQGFLASLILLATGISVMKKFLITVFLAVSGFLKIRTGFKLENPFLRQVGLLFLSLGVLKALTVDFYQYFLVSDFPIILKVASFIVLGLFLLGVSYLYHYYTKNLKNFAVEGEVQEDS